VRGDVQRGNLFHRHQEPSPVSIDTNVDTSVTTHESVPLTRSGDDHRRRRDFKRLWLGQSISAFGTQVTTLALP